MASASTVGVEVDEEAAVVAAERLVAPPPLPCISVFPSCGPLLAPLGTTDELRRLHESSELRRRLPGRVCAVRPRASVDERDLAMDAPYLEELTALLPRGRRVTLPQAFVGGRHLATTDELRRLHESGELRRVCLPGRVRAVLPFPSWQVLDAIMPTLRRAGTPGSKAIVTSTAAEHVAGLGTAEPIKLRPLPREEFWFFFRAHAFGDGAEVDPRLAAAGQAIAKRLRGSFLGGKIVGALLRSRPDAGLWRSVLNSSSVADVSCCLGDGSYVETVAGDLLPPHVSVSCVTVSGSPMKGHVGIQDSLLTLPAPPSFPDDHRPELPVLLCKSVFPSYCLYYTAHCTIDKEINQ